MSPQTTLYAKVTARTSSYYTFYDFSLTLQCINHCSVCSTLTTCDQCDSDYALTPSLECASEDTALDQNLITAFAATTLFVLLAVSGVQMQISPNLWVLINSMQILRTILLLKINLPVEVRNVIDAGNLFSQLELDFGDESDSRSGINKVLNDIVLKQYFEEYGIETYRFLDYVASVVLTGLLYMTVFSILAILWTVVYVKIKKKPMKIIKELVFSLFFLNGFVRLFLELLLDGILYT